MRNERLPSPADGQNPHPEAPHGTGPWAGATPIYIYDRHEGVLLPVGHVCADGSVHSFSAAHADDGSLRADWIDIAETLADAVDFAICVDNPWDADCGDRA